MNRHFWLLLHRYLGLAMTVFLIIVGLTGSILVFFDELNAIITPHLFPPVRAGSLLPVGTLAVKAENFFPQARVVSVYLGHSGTVRVGMEPRISPETKKPYPVNFNQLFLDPINGKILGVRQTQYFPSSVDSLIPFIYRLHYNLALDKFGMWVLGITALIWTIDCFISFYLTLPPSRRKKVLENELLPEKTGRFSSVKKSFWSRWKPSWFIKWQAARARINFDLHRASGLWLWIALLIFAWSSVYMNLHDQVYAPVMRMLSDYPQRPNELKQLDKPVDEPGLGWIQAQEKAQYLMAEQSRIYNFSIDRPIALRLDRARGVYHYSVRSSLDFQDKRGRTLIVFDANSGELKQIHLPSGQFNGLTVTNWLASLHEANVWGLTYRIFVFILGLVIFTLTVTGVLIWNRKRRTGKLIEQRNTKSRIIKNP